MDTYHCPPNALPAHLYRVQYPGSQTFLSGDGLEARDTNVFYPTDRMQEFGQSIVNQLTWGHRGAQPYISCFSDEEHAHNWALKEPWTGTSNPRRARDWTVLTIDTSLMSGTKVFKLSHLVQALHLFLPDKASQHIHGGYLCLYTVPTSAIVKQASAGEVEAEVDNRKYRDVYDPLDDYSGSDLEAAENNLNDDLAKMIEGNWD
ncbi:MAG: hypothetical protein Q9216_004342 [Gyalolechia sp. 2 TL-2023]